MTPTEALAHLREHHVTFDFSDGRTAMSIDYVCPDAPAPTPRYGEFSLVPSTDMTHVINVFADLFANEAIGLIDDSKPYEGMTPDDEGWGGTDSPPLHGY